MQNERYEEANEIKREIALQLQPSQRAQRELERMQVAEMQRQLNTAVVRKTLFSDVKRWGGTALASWRTISGSDLEFVPTPSKTRPPTLQLGSAHDAARADDGAGAVGSPGRTTDDGLRVDLEKGGSMAASGTPKKEEVEVEEDEFSETMKMLYGALGAESPDLALAAECAVRMLEMVGEDEEEDEQGVSTTRLELAGACYDKVSQTVRLHLAELAALGTCPISPAAAGEAGGDAPTTPTGLRNLEIDGGAKGLEEAIKRALGLWRVASKVEAEEGGQWAA